MKIINTKKRKILLFIGIFAMCCTDSFAQEKAPNLDPPSEVEFKPQPNDKKGNLEIPEEVEKDRVKDNYYVDPKSYGTKRVPDPAVYARVLSKTGYQSLEKIDWIQAGLDYRSRFEYRENDLRRADSGIDRPLLLRARGYLSLKEKLDPFRFVVEVEDAQREFSKYQIDNRDYNRAEPVKAYAELYYKEGAGVNRPISIRYGIHSFEFLDRRLIGSNEWRNTTNTFQGAHVSIGKEQNNWSIDLLALVPLERLTNETDKRVRNQVFGGVIGHIRQWSDIITIEPYYLGLKQSKLTQVKWNPDKLSLDPNNRVGREIHTLGLRLYNVYKSGFDYDISGIAQFGVNDTEKQQRHEAFAFTFDTGYTFAHKWKPRTGFFYGYVSGDRNPNDNTNQRFERLYGFARPWSSNDYIQMENVQTSKFVLEFEPIKKVKIDTAVVWFYLASATDRWSGANLRDQTGKSGSYMGFEYNFRIRFNIFSHLQANLGYAYFKPGDFTINTSGRDKNSHFLYAEFTAQLFE
jgi:hypothetical protein